MDNRFPLTPALSPREREIEPFGLAEKSDAGPPLPRGEGRGEGEGDETTARARSFARGSLVIWNSFVIG